MIMTIALPICFFASGVSMENPVTADHLFHLWQEHGRVAKYKPIDTRAYSRSVKLFARVLRGERTQALITAWRELDFALQPLGEGGVWVLIDKAGRGRGFYLFQENGPEIRSVQVPHGYHDRHTARIGFRIFLEGGWRAGVWNTVHRSTGAVDDARGSDSAHREKTLFQAFHHAWSEAHPSGRTIQLHGFLRNKRKTAIASEADIIISNGSKKPTQPLLVLGEELARTLSLNVRIFGHDVHELGGTTNSQARLAHRLGYTHFVHLEIEIEARKRLTRDPKFRATLLRALNSF